MTSIPEHASEHCPDAAHKLSPVLGGATPNFYIAVAVTKSKTDFSAPATNSPSPLGGHAVQCVVNAWCTPETSPQACNPGAVD